MPIIQSNITNKNKRPFTRLIKFKGIVIHRTSNANKGTGTNYEFAGNLERNESVTIEQEEGSWYGIGIDR